MSDTQGRVEVFKGGYHRKPVPVKLILPGGSNGKVKIIKPADPKLLAAYRKSPEGRRRETRQFKNLGY